MEATKIVFDECRTLHMNGIECKEFIDNYILANFTDIDRLTRTIIMDKRRNLDEWYNAIVSIFTEHLGIGIR